MASSAVANVEAPANLEIIDGRRVYRSTHVVAVINDSGADISYQVSGTIVDSLGNSGKLDPQPQIAPGSGSQSSTSDQFNIEMPADLYTSGDRITFTCTTTATGSVSDRAVLTQLTTIT
jgi:hypothetical protein